MTATLSLTLRMAFLRKGRGTVMIHVTHVYICAYTRLYMYVRTCLSTHLYICYVVSSASEK